MVGLRFKTGALLVEEQNIIQAGFDRHSALQSAPSFEKSRLNWLVYNDENSLVGALTADTSWDWVYIDELWTDESVRGMGLGTKLMDAVEKHAISQRATGIWLWTQSWQAADFYRGLGYEEFTRFENFPKGHSRIGFRKSLNY